MHYRMVGEMRNDTKSYLILNTAPSVLKYSFKIFLMVFGLENPTYFSFSLSGVQKRPLRLYHNLLHSFET
jgi:hypothetical protein